MSYVKAIGDYKYNTNDILGRGTFATVYKGYNIYTKINVAIKKVNIMKLQQTHDDIDMERIMKCLSAEIAIMKSMKHTNILTLYDFIIESDNVYMILEYCAGGNIMTYMKMQYNKLSNIRSIEELTRKIAIQIRDGVKYMHENKVSHRDLKPQNILILEPYENITDMTIKIADFGFARQMNSNQLSETVCGSPLYMAPEILRNEKYNDTADLWSIGVILYEMLIGNPPFCVDNVIELLGMYAAKGSIKLPSHIEVSDACRQLVSSLLYVNSSLRIGWHEFLNHVWFMESHANTIPDYDEQIKNNLCFGSAPSRMQNTNKHIDEVLGKLEIINDYSRSIIITHGQNSKGASILSALTQWIERIKTLIAYGCSEIYLHHYEEGSKIFAYCTDIINLMLETTICCETEKYSQISDVQQHKIDLMMYKLKDLLCESNERKTYCDANINAIDKTSQFVCKTIERLIFDKAIVLGKRGDVNIEISNKQIAIDDYTQAINLLEILVLFSSDEAVGLIRKYIELFTKKLKLI